MSEDNKQPQETETPEGTSTEENQAPQENETDYKAEAAKFKAIAERKSKQLEEVKSSLADKPKEDESNKINETQSSLSREETIFFAQGGTEETYKIADKIAKTQGVSILVAKEDPYYKFEVDRMETEAKANANQMNASTGSQTNSGHDPKALGEMTRAEHEAHFNSVNKE